MSFKCCKCDNQILIRKFQRRSCDVPSLYLNTCAFCNNMYTIDQTTGKSVFFKCTNCGSEKVNFITFADPLIDFKCMGCEKHICEKLE